MSWTGTLPHGRGSARLMTSEPAVNAIPVTWPPRRSAVVRVVPPPRTSRQLTAAFSVTVTAAAPGADRSTTVPCPGWAGPLASRSCGGGSAVGVLTRSSVPLAPKSATPILRAAVPVSTSSVAPDRSSAARVAVCGTGDDDEQAASGTTAVAPATASQRFMLGITTPQLRT